MRVGFKVLERMLYCELSVIVSNQSECACFTMYL